MVLLMCLLFLHIIDRTSRRVFHFNYTVALQQNSSDGQRKQPPETLERHAGRANINNLRDRGLMRRRFATPMFQKPRQGREMEEKREANCTEGTVCAAASVLSCRRKFSKTRGFTLHSDKV